MARVKLNSSFEYNGDKKDYYVQMKRRRFPWWIFLLLLIPLFIWLYKEYEEHKPAEIAEVTTPSEPEQPIVEPEPEQPVVEPEPEQPVEEPEPPMVQEGDTLPEPTENCGVHFSGWFLSDKDEYPTWDCSEIFQADRFGEYVGQGFYPDNTKILPNSMRNSFDAVAVRPGTHLIIYRKPNFEGDEVLNVKGPILIENVSAKNSSGHRLIMTYTFKPELQKLFPPERRQWSSEDMNNWARGSCKIICTPCNKTE